MKRLLLIVAFLVSHSLFAQELNYKIIAMFLYNFGKNIVWPENETREVFSIGVLGSNPELESALISFNGKKIVNATVTYRKITTEEEAKSCNILFFTSDKSKEIAKFSTYLANHSVLLVGIKGAGNQKGLNIMMFVDDDDNKIKFELMKTQIEAKQMKIYNSLVQLAYKVR